MQISRRDFVRAGAAAAAVAGSTPAYAANDRVQIGVIGCGARAHEIIVALSQLPAAQVTGVVDAYKGRVERAIERTNGRAKAYPSYREVIADKSIDAVVLVTPDHWHYRMVMDAIAAGKDIYCEKPLTFRSAEGVEIARAAQAAGRIVQVGSQGMSGQAQQHARSLIQAGKLGQITLIRAAYNRNTASGAWIYPIPPDAGPQTVNWDMFLGPAPKRAFDLDRFFRWRCYDDYSGGIATDLFVHLCTTIHYLMGVKAPSKVMAMGQLYRWKENREVPDTLNAILEYPEGFVVNLSSTFNNQITAEGSFQILGTEGTINLAGGLTYTPEHVVEDNRWIIDSWPRALADAYYRDPKVREQEVPATRKPRIIETLQQFRSEGQDSNIVHLGHFLDSIRTRRPHWQDAAAGHRAAACAHMVNLSVAKGRLVEWDFGRDDIKA